MLKRQEKEISKNASSCKFPDSCRSAIHPWDIETDSKFYASVTTITDEHKTKRTTAYAAANTRDDKSTNYGGSSITNFNTALLPQNPLKKHQGKKSHKRKQTDNNKNSRQKTQILYEGKKQGF
jgi:hypothetical protein